MKNLRMRINVKYKKAESQNIVTSDFIFWIAYIIALAFAVVGLSLFMRSHNQKITSSPENLEGFMLEKRFFQSCFLYERGIGVLDYSKFTAEHLNICYAGSEDSPAYLLRLAVGDDSVGIKTSNWNDGGYRVDGRFESVLVFKNGEIIDGGLAIEKYKSK